MTLANGALLLATTQFLPLVVQHDFGYTATCVGLLIAPGGVVTMAMMFVAGRLIGKIQPKYLKTAGAVIIALSMYALTNAYGDLGFWYRARRRLLSTRVRGLRSRARHSTGLKRTTSWAVGGWKLPSR